MEGHDQFQIWECLGGWFPKEVRVTRAVGWRKNIRTGLRDFARHVSFVVDEGSRVSFWHYAWYGSMAPFRLHSLLFYGLHTIRMHHGIFWTFLVVQLFKIAFY